MKLIVNPHKIEIEKTPVNEKEIDITMCEFEFSEEITDNYVKEAYFTLKGDTYKQIIVNNQCSIPYEVLTTNGTVEVGVVAYLVENEEEIKRYNPSPAYFDTWVGSLKDDAENSQEITPSEMEQYEQALQDGLSEVNDKLDAMDTALEEVDNLDVDANKVDTTTTITITKKDGTTKEVQVLDGNTGPAGRDGVDGSNGITPTIGDNGNWYLGNTDTGKPSRGIQGETGEPGATGQDGISPIATVSKSGDTATISITDKNGTTTTTVKDGQDGTNGRDGYVQYTAGDNITIENNVISASASDAGDYIIRRMKFHITLDSFSNIGREQELLYESELNSLLNECKQQNKRPAIAVDNILCLQSDGNLTGNFITFRGFYILGDRDGNFSANDKLNYASTYTVRFNYNIVNNQISVYSMNNYDVKTQFLGLNNTASYTPSNDYNPATKKYVDDAVAGAGGSGEEHYLGNVSDYSSSNRINLNDLDVGMYHLYIQNGGYGTFNFYFKASKNDVETTLDTSVITTYPTLYNDIELCVYKKISDVVSNETVLEIHYISLDFTGNRILRNVKEVKYNASSNTLNSPSVSNRVYNITSTDTTQTITGKKTFSTLPESSVTPTTNNQLVNKSYVDSAITSAITTTLQGGY